MIGSSKLYNFILFIAAPDAPPQNVQTEAFSSTEIQLSWEEVPEINQNGEIILYEIQYTPLTSFGGLIATNSVNTSDGSMQEITIRHLQENVEYSISVRAYTNVGPGPFSLTVSVTMLEGGEMLQI